MTLSCCVSLSAEGPTAVWQECCCLTSEATSRCKASTKATERTEWTPSCFSAVRAPDSIDRNLALCLCHALHRPTYPRPLAPGTYKLTAVHEGYEAASATVVVPKDGSGARQDFKLLPVAGGAGGTKASWEQQLSISTHPMLRHVVLRSHHIFALAVAGMLLCGAGGWVLLRLVQGKPLRLPDGLRSGGGGRNYELVMTSLGTTATANGHSR